MACCGKQREASRANPIVVGSPDGELYRVRLLLSQFGLRYGSVGWFSGSGVMERVAAGTLELVP